MSGRKRTTDRHYSAEDQALDQISKEAEERIQARRQVRAEAREIRLKEIERQQKEEEDRQKGTDSTKTQSSYAGSRRGSDDSTDTDTASRDGKESKDQLRDLKHSLREMEEKFRQAMVTNAQLDNIKTSHIFQLELLKEQMEEKEEAMIEVQREYKEKCRELEFLKRDFNTMKLENEQCKQMLEIRDKLLKESGLVIIASDEGELSLTKCSDMSDLPVGVSGTSLISEAAADLLKKAGEGTLDDKLKKIITERKTLQDEIDVLSTKLEESRGKKENNSPKVATMNGPEQQLYEVQREASKQIHEYKLKLQKAEQEITNLDGTVNRLETQVKRYKYDADEAEKLEDELKTERRRLQRELRECQNQIEELQNQNKHLTKRLEKIRQSRSTLMNP